MMRPWGRSMFWVNPGSLIGALLWPPRSLKYGCPFPVKTYLKGKRKKIISGVDIVAGTRVVQLAVGSIKVNGRASWASPNLVTRCVPVHNILGIKNLTFRSAPQGGLSFPGDENGQMVGVLSPLEGNVLLRKKKLSTFFPHLMRWVNEG